MVYIDILCVCLTLILNKGIITSTNSRVFVQTNAVTELARMSDITTEASTRASADTNLQNQVNSLNQSVSNGKTQVANAITGKGVAASGSDSFATLASKISQIQSKSQGESAFLNSIVPRVATTYRQTFVYPRDIISVSGSVTLNFQKTGINGITLNGTYQLSAYKEQAQAHILTGGYGFLTWGVNAQKVSNDDLSVRLYPARPILSAQQSSEPEISVRLIFTKIEVVNTLVHVTATWPETVLSSESIIYQTRGSITLHAGSCVFKPMNDRLYAFPETISVPPELMII